AKLVNVARVLGSLAGVWSLQNNTLYIDGTAQPEDKALGAFPHGTITYGLNGFMSEILVNSRPEYRPTGLTWPAEDSQSTED
ncbi:hypothetical protein K504DRAFT_171747, partial [Pleomassaria siparia CBS 279.74]